MNKRKPLLVQKVPETHSVVAGDAGHKGLPNTGGNAENLCAVKGLSHQLKVHLILLQQTTLSSLAIVIGQLVYCYGRLLWLM